VKVRLYPVPQNALCVSAGMNPERLWPGFGLRSYGVNGLNSLQPCGVTSRLRPPISVVDNTPRGKATDVSPWYGVYPETEVVP
jgi:hypothetical protein